MSSVSFTRTEVAAAVARGVRQFVMIGLRSPMHEALSGYPDSELHVFAMDEDPGPNAQSTFVKTQFASESLDAALEKSGFDRFKASLFVWVGGAGYRTIEGVMGSLKFIASLPQGSGVVFDYAVERTSTGSMTDTALDALASRFCVGGGTLKYFIQPPAVMAMLRSMGFRQVVELAAEELSMVGGRLVSAVV